MQHRDELHELIAQAMATLSKDEIRVRAPCARSQVVLTFDEVLEDEHLAYRDFWQSVTVAGHAYQSPGLGLCIDAQRKPQSQLHVVNSEGSL